MFTVPLFIFKHVHVNMTGFSNEVILVSGVTTNGTGCLSGPQKFIFDGSHYIHTYILYITNMHK